MGMKKLTNFGLLSISLIVTFAVLETGTRALEDRISDDAFYLAMGSLQLAESSQHLTYDKRLGWIPKPNTVIPSHAWTKKISILDHGIRSNGFNSNPDNAGPLILALGDSFTFGHNASDNETWPSYLERMSGDKVLNGGVSGYGFDQIFMRAIDLSKIYVPDVLVVSFIADDMRRCLYDMKYGSFKPYFDIATDDNGNKSMKLMNVPVPYKKLEPGPIRRLAGMSYFVNFAMVRLFPSFWFQNTALEEHRILDREKSWDITRTLIRSLDSFSTGEKIRVVLVAQYDKHLSSMDASQTNRIFSYIKESGLDIETIDLYRQLKEIRENDAPRFAELYYSNNHMTKFGNSLVASLINDYLN
jgi:hypothetical protein